jgi:hypothetical protein
VTSTTPALPRPRDPISDLALKVLGGAVAGIGTLGFVTAVGGAITYVRFGRAGLAAEQAVAVQPKAVLLTLGAEALVPLAVVIVFGIALFFLVDKTWRAAGSMMAPERVRRMRSSRTVIVSSGLSGGVGALIYYVLAVKFSFNTGSIWVIVDIVVAMIFWMVLATRINGFPARAAALAVLLALLATAIGLSRTYSAPKVRGAAVVLGTSGKVVSGLFVAETPGLVYLGEVTPSATDGDLPRRGSGSILALDRKEVTTIVLGANQGLSTALRDADLMAAALRRDPSGASIAAALAAG